MVTNPITIDDIVSKFTIKTLPKFEGDPNYEFIEKLRNSYIKSQQHPQILKVGDTTAILDSSRRWRYTPTSPTWHGWNPPEPECISWFQPPLPQLIANNYINNTMRHVVSRIMLERLMRHWRTNSYTPSKIPIPRLLKKIKLCSRA